LANCTGITRDGERCRGIAIDGSDYCYAHDPDRAEDRRRNAHKGGKRGGRGRPSVELVRLQARFEGLAEKVLSGEVERGVGAVAGQLLNGARACVRDTLAAREQEDLVARLEELEEGLERNANKERSDRFGAQELGKEGRARREGKPRQLRATGRLPLLLLLLRPRLVGTVHALE